MTTGAPTESDDRIRQAANELSPDKSLARTADVAKFVFGNAAVVGTVLSGVGLATGGNSILQGGLSVEGIALTPALMGISLLFATLALTPALLRINVNDLTAVQRFFEHQILRRGACSVVAMLALAGSLSSALASAAGSSRQHVLALEGSIQSAGAIDAVVINVNAGGFSDGTSVTVTAERAAAGHGRQKVCEVVDQPVSTQTDSILCGRVKLPASGELVLTAVAQDDKGVIQSKLLRLSLGSS